MKDEPVDICDEQGEPTGEVMLKSEAHNKSLWHPVVHLWIYNSKNQALMQKRSSHKKVWPNKWDVAVAGHIAAGDNAKNTLVREVKEELGLEIDIKDTNFVERIKFEHSMPENWTNRIFIDLYSLKTELDGSKLTLEEEEVAEIQWIDIGELAKKIKGEVPEITPDVVFYFPTIMQQIYQHKNWGDL